MAGKARTVRLAARLTGWKIDLDVAPAPAEEEAMPELPEMDMPEPLDEDAPVLADEEEAEE